LLPPTHYLFDILVSKVELFFVCQQFKMLQLKYIVPSLVFLFCLAECKPQVNSDTNSDEDDTCEALEKKTNENKPCQFPFIYKDRTYVACTTFNDTKPWCSTKTNPSTNEHIDARGHWGYCDQECFADTIVTDGASLDADSTVCDQYACNGLKLGFMRDGMKAFDIGECTTGLEDAKKGDLFCFVNEDSVCEKKPSKYPGMYVSTEPCKDPTLVTERFLFLLGLLGVNQVTEAIYNAAAPTLKFRCPSGNTFESTEEDMVSNMKKRCYGCWDQPAECSGPALINGLISSSFHGSCVLHDMCYLKKGRSKSGCDSDFLYNMQKQCGTDVACRATLAPSVYGAVKHDGGAQSGYERAQRIARTCRLY